MSLPISRNHSSRTGLALAATCLWLAACAGPRVASTGPAFRDPLMTLHNARDAIVAGTSTRAEVLAALGPATEINFDSGYAVWVYREKSSGSETDRAEFVILFAPTGVVKKTRLRPAYAAHGTG